MCMQGAMSILPQDIEEVQGNEGDYIGDDGLLYCRKCNTRKQKRLPVSEFLGGREMTVRCMCKCEVEEKERKDERARKMDEMERIERLRSCSLIDNKLKGARFETFQKESENQKVYDLAEKYVQRFDEMYQNRQGILFWGTAGTGKSFTAACIANELLSRMEPVVMTSFVKILQNIQNKPEEEKAFMSVLNNVKLVIIDDLGTERNTDYALEKVYNIIDSRYRTGKPLILTTNMTVREMQETTDIRYKRIYDRIFEMCYPVRMSGRSWREREAANRFDRMKKLMEE